MARYIDADELLKELQEELDFETPMYTEEQNKYFNSGLRCAIRDVKKAPTADVVPKSEVEQLKRNLEQCENGYRQQMHLLQCKLADEQSKVREIFEKLENRAFGFGACFVEMTRTTFDEIKKKYTESEDTK